MKYDFVFLTNLPAFYKLNLYNAIAKEKKILVVFLGNDAAIRNEDFFKGERLFKYNSLMGKKKYQIFFFLLKIILTTRAKFFVLGGWDTYYMWFCWLLIPRKKTALVVESSILESKIYGFHGWLKRIFISKISLVYASGCSQTELVRALGFRKRVIETKGVGLFNIITKPALIIPDTIKNFIYVGRLSPEKNLELLIKVFNELPQYNLNIIGFGPLELSLKNMAKSNISFLGPIDNKKISKYYLKNDVFILPSITEPWGLVVEEALNNALPVIVSDRVGCAREIIKQDFNGIIFPYNDVHSLKKAIMKITTKEYYINLKKNVLKMDFHAIAQKQIECYTSSL